VSEAAFVIAGWSYIVPCIAVAGRESECNHMF